MVLLEFAANNAVNMAIGHSPFFLNFGGYPLVTSVFMHSGVVLNQIEAIHTMVDQIKTSQEEA